MTKPDSETESGKTREEEGSVSDEELGEVSGGHHSAPRRPRSSSGSFDRWHNLPDGSGSGFGE